MSCFGHWSRSLSPHAPIPAALTAIGPRATKEVIDVGMLLRFQEVDAVTQYLSDMSTGILRLPTELGGCTNPSWLPSTRTIGPLNKPHVTPLVQGHYHAAYIN